MSPISIGYYDEGEHRAGTGRYLFEIIGGLDRRKFFPVFFAPKPRSWHNDLRELQIEIVYPVGTTGDMVGSVPLPSVGDRQAEEGTAQCRPTRRLRLPAGIAWSVGLLREMQAARALFTQRPVDLLHSNNTGAEPAPIAAKQAGIPYRVGTLHVLPSYDLHNERGNWQFRTLERASMNSLHRIIGCCEAAGRDWQERCGFPTQKLRTVHNGIETERVTRRQSKQAARSALNLPPDAVLIGAMGNLHPYKGYPFLLRGVASLREVCPDVHLVIAGTGPDEAELKALASELNLDHCVTFLGFCSDVRTVLESLDIYAQASLVEAFPMAILEAMMMGLPVVATEVGGVPEAVLEGKTGLLVPPKNAEAISKALHTLALRPDLRELMGEAGQCRVQQNFTRDQMVEKTLAVYDEVLKRGAS
jgi:glycosyltransferase involved in cell wall biosynthesis